jgi:hypothetical protein
VLLSLFECEGLFEKREGRLREERDSARQQLDVSMMERDAAESRAADLNSQLVSLRDALEVKRGTELSFSFNRRAVES